jgi:CheY-like chemotaxis protein
VRALLVDDDHELARLLREYLEPHGVSVDHVAEGLQALERLAASGST